METIKEDTMFDNLTKLGFGIVTFAIVIGVGVVVLARFGNAVGGDANTTAVYLIGQLGSSGLAGWTPAIIALVIGMLFLGMFLVGKGRRR